MDVSIVIVNWNTRDDLREALQSCLDYCGDQEIELIVVDNGSADGSVEMVRSEFPQVQLIANEENRGYTAACNQGMERAQGRYYLMLNSDAELTEGCLDELVRVMDECDDIGTASARLRYPDGSKQFTACRFPSLLSRMLPAQLTHRLETVELPDAAPDGIVDVDWVFGACQIVRADTADDVGLMDERIFMWYDDAEWCRRMAKAGWRRVVAVDATCVHKARKSADRLPPLRLNLIVSMSLFEYFRIHEGRLKTFILWLCHTGFAVAKSVLLGLGHVLTLGRIERIGGLLRFNAGRLWWHLRHFSDILIREPKAYRGEDVQ